MSEQQTARQQQSATAASCASANDPFNKAWASSTKISPCASLSSYLFHRRSPFLCAPGHILCSSAALLHWPAHTHSEDCGSLRHHSQLGEFSPFSSSLPLFPPSSSMCAFPPWNQSCMIDRCGLTGLTSLACLRRECLVEKLWKDRGFGFISNVERFILPECDPWQSSRGALLLSLLSGWLLLLCACSVEDFGMFSWISKIIVPLFSRARLWQQQRGQNMLRQKHSYEHHVMIKCCLSVSVSFAIHLQHKCVQCVYLHLAVLFVVSCTCVPCNVICCIYW